MIDERINQSLQELENQLKEVESARRQVENTINSFNGLTVTTSNYVSNLSTINEKLDEIVSHIGDDYKNKVKEFEKDRDEIVRSSNTVITKIENKTSEIQDAFDQNVKSIQKKLLYSLILNAVMIIALAALFFVK